MLFRFKALAKFTLFKAVAPTIPFKVTVPVELLLIKLPTPALEPVTAPKVVAPVLTIFKIPLKVPVLVKLIVLLELSPKLTLPAE